VWGGPLNGQSRTVSPPNRHPGAQYLLIDSDPGFANAHVPQGNFPMAIRTVESPLYRSQMFDRVLFDFLSQTTGRQFSDKVSATDWSRVIWDLIENGLAKGFFRATLTLGRLVHAALRKSRAMYAVQPPAESQ
jgi:hypothetical protein